MKLLLACGCTWTWMATAPAHTFANGSRIVTSTRQHPAIGDDVVCTFHGAQRVVG